MSNIFSHQSFSVFTPSPYPTLLHSIFPFRNKQLILIGRRSRCVSVSSTPRPIDDARSSSDLVLLSTTVHRDGSLLFRFGDASEVVEKDDVVEETESISGQESTIGKVLENDDVVKEIESKSRQESSIVKVLENDDVVEEIESKSRQESTIVKVLENDDVVEEIESKSRQESPIVKVLENDDVVEEIESKSRQGSTIVKVLDGDQEREVTIKRVERGYGLDDMRITEVADEITNADTDSGIDERNTKFTSDLSDSNEESSDILSEIYEEEVLSSQSEAKENDSLEILLDETDSTAQLDNDESSVPTVSLLDNSPNKYKSPETDGTLVKDSDDDPSVSVNLESLQVSKVEVMDVEKPYDGKESDKVKSEDTVEGDTEGLMPPASMPISEVELMDAANEDIDEAFQDRNISEGIHIDEMPPSDLLVEPAFNEVEVTMEASSIESVIVTDQVVEDGLQEVSTNNKEENDVSYVMPISRKEEAELTAEEEEVNQTQSASLELEPTLQVSYTEPQYATGQYPDGGILQVKEESEDLPVSVKPETVKVSDIEVQDAEGPNFDDGIIQVTDESEDPSASVEFETQISDIELQDTMGQNPDDGTVQVTDEIEVPSVSVKFETIQISDIEDTMGPNPDDGNLQVTDESEDPLVSVKLETQIADIEFQDTMGPGLDDAILQVNDESEDPSVSVNHETMQVSNIELLDTVGPNLDDGILQVTDESEDPSVSVRSETIQVLDTELVDTTDQNPDDGILQVSDESEDPSVSVELETMQDSSIEVMDVKKPYAEDKLDKVETEDTSEGDTKELLPPATIHNISDVELTDAANEDMEEQLQDMKISEGTLIDGMIISDSIRSEPTVDEVMQLQSSDVELEGGMEVSTTNGMDVKDWSVDDELLQVSIDNQDEIDVADVMTFQEQDSMPIELTPTMQDSDVEIQDATSQNLDDGILQVINEEAGDSFTMDVEQFSHKLEGQPVQDEGENHNILEQCAETNAPGISIQLKQDALDTLPEAEKTAEDVSSSELAEVSEDTALLLTAEAKVQRDDIYLTDEFLSSGAAFLVHPFKALTGGDDAYFVAGGKWLGVANGVSQWSFEGTDPGVYARELMKTCEDIVLNTRSVPVTNPVELLCRGVKETNMSGSSNVLIASFDGQALHVANIGDTGFLIIRHGAIYKKSSPLLHEFHFAMQVKDCDDPLQLMEECTIELEEGDIVVSATDGLFDNLYEREIAMIVSKSLKAEMRPQEIANVLATRAQEVGKSAFVRSPFSDAAQAAGYTGYSGGKPDNVAVIVSLVEKRSNVLGE